MASQVVMRAFLMCVIIIRSIVVRLQEGATPPTSLAADCLDLSTLWTRGESTNLNVGSVSNTEQCSLHSSLGNMDLGEAVATSCQDLGSMFIYVDYQELPYFPLSQSQSFML